MIAQPKRQSQPVAPVLAVCAAFAAKPSAYSPSTRKPDVAPPCGSFGESGKHRANIRGKQPLRPEHSKGQNREILNAAAEKQEKPLSREDAESLQNVISYIADHYAFDISLERLASIVCMSETKLKGCFRRQFGCSVTQYIQGRRMSQAEHLLIETDFTMGQIAPMIGYTTSSRFAVLFKKSTGILPIEYRKIARKDC